MAERRREAVLVWCYGLDKNQVVEFKLEAATATTRDRAFTVPTPSAWSCNFTSINIIAKKNVNWLRYSALARSGRSRGDWTRISRMAPTMRVWSAPKLRRIEPNELLRPERIRLNCDSPGNIAAVNW